MKIEYTLLIIYVKSIKANPDYETALARIKLQAAKNPKGASAKVLKFLEKAQSFSSNNTYKPF